MRVWIPCFDGDVDRANRLVRVVERCNRVTCIQRWYRVGTSVLLSTYARRTSGDVHVETTGDSGALVRADGWPYSCTSMFAEYIKSQPIGTIFTLLEPDAVPTRKTAFAELAVEFDKHNWVRYLNGIRPASVMGHWKVPGVAHGATVAHMSGVSVYRVTPELKSAAERLHAAKPWDLQMFFRRLLSPIDGIPTNLIRCFWGTPVGVGSISANKEAAVIHGDKTGRLLDHVEGMGW